MPASSMWIASDSLSRCWYCSQDLQRIAQRALMREQQAHDAEVGELARLRHAQTEGAAARHARGLFEQRDRGRERDALLGIGKQLAAQIDFGQQRLRIQARGAPPPRSSSSMRPHGPACSLRRPTGSIAAAQHAGVLSASPSAA